MRTLGLLTLAVLLVGCSRGISTAEERTEYDPAQRERFSPPIGMFEGESYLCTTYAGGGRCDATVRDCLSVAPAARDQYLVKLHSTQANQHVCSASLLMSLEGRSLVYSGEVSGFTIRMHEIGGAYEISAKGVAGENDSVYCGVHASIDGYKIQNVRKSGSAESCPSPDD